VKCGDSILLIDQRFGSPHVRTEDGKDGYMISQNFGQWSIEPQSGASPTSVAASPGSTVPAPPSPPPSAPRTSEPQTQRVSGLTFAETPPAPARVLQPGNQSSPGSLLLDGTPIRIRLNRNVSSADAKVGESVDFEVLDEIKVGEVTVIPRGA